MSDKLSANTDDLKAFVSSGRQYVKALESMQVNLQNMRNEAQSAMGESAAMPSSSAPRLQELIVEASNNNQFVNDLHDILHHVGVRLGDTASANAADVAAGLRSAGHLVYDGDRTLEQDLAYRERLIRHDALRAMQEGRNPYLTDIPLENFPPEYVAMQKLDAEIAALVADRDDADGFGWWPWDNNGESMASIDAELEQKRAERADLADQLGASGSGRLTEVEAIAALGDHTGDRAWEGEQYGRWTSGHEELVAYDDYGNITVNYRSGRSYGDEYTRIGNEVTANTEVALGFYNELGAEGAAHLPTALADSVGRGNDDEDLDAVLADFSVALADVSKLQHPNGSPRLEFTGDDLMAVPLVNNSDTWGAIYHPAFLFVSGDFAQEFLVDATTESLRQADKDPDSVAVVSVAASEYGPSVSVPGEDARNILLARAGEDPESAAAVVAQLAATDEVDLLLSPEVPFAFTYREGVSYHPDLESDAVITTFLTVAGSDDRSANTLMHAAADDPEPFSDPLVAAGIDGLMAQHASIMYDPSVLRAVGIDRTGINHLTPSAANVVADAWRAVHAKVLDHGQGEALTAATFGLVDEAIGGSLDRGDFDPELVDPFATMAGALRAETSEARFAYLADLDEAARERNQRLNTAVNVGFDLVGSIPHPAAAIGAPIGSALYTYFDPLAGPTDQELAAYRDQYLQLQVAGQDIGSRWQTYIYHRCLVAAMEINDATGEPHGATVVLPTGEQATVAITYEDGQYLWKHPVSGEVETVPHVNGDEYERYFELHTPIGSAVAENSKIFKDYMDGILAAADDREDVIWRRAFRGLDNSHVNEETGEIVGNGSRHRLDYADKGVGKAGVDQWVAEG